MEKRSSLVVPVPAAERLVGSWRERHDWSSAIGVPAHITVMGPFLPPSRIDDADLALLEELAARTDRFAFRLTQVERLGSVTVLVPEPERRFARLSAEIHRVWPALRPHGAAFDEQRFRLTVARCEDDLVHAALDRAIRATLPLDCRTDALHLVTEQSAGQAQVREWSLRSA